MLQKSQIFNGKLFKKDHMFLLSYSVEQMVKTGKEILQKNNITDLMDVRWATFCGTFCSLQLFTLLVSGS